MKTVLYASALIFATNFAQAFPGVDAVRQAILERAKALPATHRKPENCADLSGNWKGICTVTSGSSSSQMDSALQITQLGCSFIQMGNSIQPIGGIDTSATTADRDLPFSMSNGTVLDWNADQTELLCYDAGVYRAGGGQMEGSFQGSGKTKLDGGKLVSTFGAPGIVSVNCVYDKQ